MTTTPEPVLYREEQRFSAWAWSAPAVAAGLVAWALLSRGFGIPSGARPSDVVILAVAVLICVLTALLVGVSRLAVEVRSGLLRVRFFPFSTREILASDIVACEIRRYRPIREYGGWGMRYSFRRGWAYTVKGTLGVQLRLRDGRGLLVGSQEPERLARAIRSVLSS